MRLLLLKTLIFVLGPQLAIADDWLCKEASSVRNGNTFLTCGVSSAPSLEDARANALRRAKEEFHAVCNSSEDCRIRDFIITPKRTDCKTDSSGQHTCYRALEIQTTDQERKDITVDIDAVETQISGKQVELRMLRQRLEQQKQLNKLDEQIEIAKAQLETDVESLKDKVDADSIKNREYGYSHLNKPWSLGFHTFCSTHHTFGEANSALGLGIRFERRFMRRLGLQFDLSYGSDFYSKEPQNTGTPSTSKAFRGMMTSTEFVVGLPVYFQYQYYLKPILGTVSLSRTDKQIDYSVLGTKSNSTDIKHSRLDSFYGLGLGYVTEPVDAAGSKYFFEFSGRCIISCSNIHLNALIGIQLSF